MKKNRFTFVDIFIVLAVVVIAVAGYIILKPESGISKETKPVKIKMLATAQDEGITKRINDGDDVIISFSEDVHATVVDAYEEERYEYFFNAFSGKYIKGRVQDKSDVYVELTAEAVVSDTAISVDNLSVRVGDWMPVRGKGYVVTGFVVDISEE